MMLRKKHPNFSQTYHSTKGETILRFEILQEVLGLSKEAAPFWIWQNATKHTVTKQLLLPK